MFKVKLYERTQDYWENKNKPNPVHCTAHHSCVVMLSASNDHVCLLVFCCDYTVNFIYINIRLNVYIYMYKTRVTLFGVFLSFVTYVCACRYWEKGTRDVCRPRGFSFKKSVFLIQ